MASVMDNTTMKIEKLNGKNYIVWSKQMEWQLAAKGLWKYVKSTVTLPGTAHATYTRIKKEKDSCIALIGCSIESQIVPMIIAEDDPHKMWKKLETSFKSSCSAAKHTLRAKLMSLKMKSKDSIRNYANEISFIEHELTFAGHVVDEEDKKFVLLNGLREEFNMKKAILQEKLGTTSFEALIASLEQYEQEYKRNGSGSGSSSAPAFITAAAPTKKKSCYLCKKPHYMDRCWYNPKSKQYKQGLKPSDEIVKELKKRNLYTGELDGAHIAFMTYNGSNMKNKWFLDSCASRHLTNQRDSLKDYRKLENTSNIGTAATGTKVSIVGVGSIELEQEIDGVTSKFTLDNVGYAPNLVTNLISAPWAQKSGIYIHLLPGKDGRMEARKDGKTIMKGNSIDDGICELPNITVSSKRNTKIALFSAGKTDGLKLMHRRAAHVSVRTLQDMLKLNAAYGLDILQNATKGDNICKACCDGKATKSSHKSREKSKKDVLELVHSDLAGKIKPKGLNGEEYMQLLVDDVSGAMWVMNIRTKGCSKVSTMQLINAAQAVSKQKVITIRTDLGKEFTGKVLEQALASDGVHHETTPPYSPESNAKVERKNRTVVEAARTMISELNTITGEDYRILWPEAVSCAVYVLNRTLSKGTHESYKEKTPYEVITGKRPDLKHLRIFGTAVKVMKHPSKRNGKMDTKTWNGIHVGYEFDGAYRIFVPSEKRVIVSRDVTFFEKLYRRGPLEGGHHVSDSNEIEIDLSTDDGMSESLPTSPQNESNLQEESQSDEEVPPQNDRPRRSDRNTSRPDRYGDFTALAFVTVESLHGNEPDVMPRTASEALKQTSNNEWKDAMFDELSSIAINGVFEIAKRPVNRRVIQCRWVFAVKRDENNLIVRYKARLVAKGYSQVAGIDFGEVFAPVTRFETFRFLLGIVADRDYELRQIDVKTAFLHGDLKEELYMEFPELPHELREHILKQKDVPSVLQEIVQSKGGLYVLRLRKSIYGLRQAAKVWYKKFKSVLIKVGFNEGTSDPCLFIMRTGGNIMYILIYVDDILIAAPTSEDSKSIESKLGKVFPIKALGNAKYFLGMRIVRNRSAKTVKLLQDSYIERVAKRFGFENIRTSHVPMFENLELFSVKKKRLDTSLPYRELVGCLMYISVSTRPDIMYAVSRLARFNACYSEEHWIAAKNVLRYLVGTKSMGLIFQGSEIAAYSDASHGQDKETRRSTTGYLLKIGQCSFMWKSSLQPVVAESSCEAEWVALATCAKECAWMRKVYIDFSIKKELTDIYADSTCAIANAFNETESIKLKHVDIKHKLVKNYVAQGWITVKYLPTNAMPADGLTKALGRTKFESNRNLYGLY